MTCGHLTDIIQGHGHGLQGLTNAGPTSYGLRRWAKPTNEHNVGRMEEVLK